MAFRPMRIAHPMGSRKQLSPHHVAEMGKEHCIFIVIVIVRVNVEIPEQLRFDIVLDITL
jgi:hypothetical protein